MRERYLEGEKVFLSPVEETDVSALRKIKNQKCIRLSMSPCIPQTDADVLADINIAKSSGSPYFLIFKKSVLPKKRRPIGFVKLEILSSIFRGAEIHIGILKKYTRKGYGSEVINMITDYAFNELNMHSLRAFIKGKNYASQKAFENQNYQRAGTLQEGAYYDGGYNDCVLYHCIPCFRKE